VDRAIGDAVNFACGQFDRRCGMRRSLETRTLGVGGHRRCGWHRQFKWDRCGLMPPDVVQLSRLTLPRSSQTRPAPSSVRALSEAKRALRQGAATQFATLSTVLGTYPLHCIGIGSPAKYSRARKRASTAGAYRSVLQPRRSCESSTATERTTQVDAAC